MRTMLLVGAALSALVTTSTVEAAPTKSETVPAVHKTAWKDLPDWSGVWQMMGNTVFDHATAEPPTGGAGPPGVREHPPNNAEWEAKYQHNLELVNTERLPDTASFCGSLSGVPRMYNHPDGYEWAITPTRVWMYTENGPQRRVVYTDGRPHMKGKLPPHSYTGDSIGHWEGDTLVVDTIGLPPDTLMDRTGALIGENAHVTERVRRIDANALEAQIVIDDPTVFTKPWRVTKRFRKLAKNSYIFDYVCNENNRNPVSADGRTQTTDTSGKVIAE